MPKIELETPEQKQKFGDWIKESTSQGRIIKSDKITRPSSYRIDIYYTADDALVVLEETDDVPDPQNILYTSEIFIEELKKAGVIFERDPHSAMPLGGSL